MDLSNFDRVTAFENRFARSQATEVVEFRWGFALLQSEFALSHYHNRIVVTSAASAEEILATSEAVMSGAKVKHRFISVNNDTLGLALQADLKRARYQHEAVVTMIYQGPRVTEVQPVVEAVSTETLRPALIRDWQLELPKATPEELEQLADRTALYDRGAEFTPLAVVEGGVIAAHADLYIDRQDSIAQFESLVTHKDFHQRGYATALVREALRRGHEADCEISFLTADLDDWPRQWYGRLGYVEVGRTHHFSTS